MASKKQNRRQAKGEALSRSKTRDPLYQRRLDGRPDDRVYWPGEKKRPGDPVHEPPPGGCVLPGEWGER